MGERRAVGKYALPGGEIIELVATGPSGHGREKLRTVELLQGKGATSKTLFEGAAERHRGLQASFG